MAQDYDLLEIMRVFFVLHFFFICSFCRWFALVFRFLYLCLSQSKSTVNHLTESTKITDKRIKKKTNKRKKKPKWESLRAGRMTKCGYFWYDKLCSVHLAWACNKRMQHLFFSVFNIDIQIVYIIAYRTLLHENVKWQTTNTHTHISVRKKRWMNVMSVRAHVVRTSHFHWIPQYIYHRVSQPTVDSFDYDSCINNN